MTTNDVVLIQELLSQRRQELAPDMSESDFFQIFAGEQALKDRDLSYDEILDGIVDGGIAVRVVLTHHVTDDAGGLFIRLVPVVVLFVHRKQGAPVNRF